MFLEIMMIALNNLVCV